MTEGQGRLSKLSRAALSTPELLKIQQARSGQGPQQTWFSHCPDIVTFSLASVSPSWRQCGHSESSFSLTFHSRLLLLAGFFVFPRSAALAGASPGSALFCFAAGPTTDALPGRAARSTAEEASLFRSVPGRFSMNRKGGRGPTGRSHRNSSTWFSTSSRKVGTQDPAICWALSLTRLLLARRATWGFHAVSLRWADSFGDRQVGRGCFVVLC